MSHKTIVSVKDLCILMKINVSKMCVGEWSETPKTTPRKLRTLEIVLKDVENTQNWWFFLVFPIVFLVHWHILDVLMLQLFSFFLFFGIKFIPFYQQLWTTKGREIAVERFIIMLEEITTSWHKRKRLFLKQTPRPPPFAPCRESNSAHMNMCNIHIIILILRKTLFFWSWQPTMTTC